VIPDLTKSRRRGPPIEAFYPRFTDDPKFFPLLAMQAYEERTKGHRKSFHSCNPVFISIKKPFKPVKPATIGHWLNNLMKEAGIDTSAFTVHSTWGNCHIQSTGSGSAHGRNIESCKLELSLNILSLLQQIHCLLSVWPSCVEQQTTSHG